jgi:hypothetical protein
MDSPPCPLAGKRLQEQMSTDTPPSLTRFIGGTAEQWTPWRAVPRAAWEALNKADRR